MFYCGNVTDRSGAITVGGASQVVAPTNPNRKFFFFQNNSDTAMWIVFSDANAAVASQPSISVPAGTQIQLDGMWVPIDRVSVFCATIGKTFTCNEGQ